MDPVQKHADGDLIRHQIARVHVGLGLHPKLRAVLDVGAENVAGGNMGNPVTLCNPLGLCSLSCSRCSQHDNLHKILPPL